MEILAVGRDPIRRYIVLRGRQIDIAAAHHPMQPVFQLIFYVRVPHRVLVGLGPQVADIGRAPKLRRNQIVHLVRIGPWRRHSIFFKYLPPQRNRHHRNRPLLTRSADITFCHRNRRPRSQAQIGLFPMSRRRRDQLRLPRPDRGAASPPAAIWRSLPSRMLAS